MRKSAKSEPVSEQKKAKETLNVAFGSTFTCCNLISTPALRVCVPKTFERVSLAEYVSFHCFKLVMGVPMTKESKTTFSTPTIDGASGKMPPGFAGSFGAAKPWEVRLGPTPPTGCPTLFALRM